MVGGCLIEGTLLATVSASDRPAAEWIPTVIGAWLTVAALSAVVWWSCRAASVAGEPGGRLATWLIIGFAILFRVTMLAAPPDLLSVDSRRYVWDGRVTLTGVSPFAHTPIDPALARLDADGLARQTNSPTRFSVYPPVMQVIFAGAALPGGTWQDAAWRIRAVMVVCDVASVCLLISLLAAAGLPRWHALLYAWHPLPIIEFGVSGHTEAAMIVLLLLALRLLQADRVRWAMLALAGAVLAKLLPVLLVPFVLRRHGWRHVWIVPVVCVVGFAPFITPQVVENVGSSLRLYFGTFEFNNGRWWSLAAARGLLTAADGGDAWALRMHALSPVMLILAATWMLALLAAMLHPRWRDVPLPWVVLLVFGGYLCFSPSVHPWYLAIVLCMMPFIRSAAWLWLSALAGATYVAYVTVPPAEDLRVVALAWSGFALLLAAAGLRRLRAGSVVLETNAPATV